MRGAPAPFPMAEESVPLQKYLMWSDKIEEEVQQHIHTLFNGEKFIGIHLRNGIDWVIVVREIYWITCTCINVLAHKGILFAQSVWTEQYKSPFHNHICTSLCRHIYNWSIIDCDFKQTTKRFVLCPIYFFQKPNNLLDTTCIQTWIYTKL